MFRRSSHQDDDPIVRATVARLRASVLAATLGSVAFFLLGLNATRVAWIEGLERGRAGGSAGAMPDPALLAVIVGGFVALGIMLVLVVRAPFNRARRQALELADASKRLQENTLETFAALGAAVEAKDRYTA